MRRSVVLLGLLAMSSAALQPRFAGADTADDSCLEPFALRNHQTGSATQGEYVESSSYLGLPTVVMLLSSG